MPSAKILPFGVALALLGPWAASADEPPFATLYGIDVMPAGETEVEQWAGWQSGKPDETFNSVFGRTEFEYGVTDRFQVAAGPIYDWARIRPHDAEAPDAARDGVKFRAVSVEAIYRLLDPKTQPFGLALYLEPAIGPGYREVEAKLLLQKNLLDGRLILAANAIMESEWHRSSPDVPPLATEAASGWDKETEFNLLLGAAYRFAPDWSGGAEFAANREVDGLAWRHDFSAAATSYYLGPTLHYDSERYWVTLGAQAQLPWAANLSGELGETAHGFARDQERYRIRLRFGVDL
jgi:hypothetical protein